MMSQYFIYLLLSDIENPEHDIKELLINWHTDDITILTVVESGNENRIKPLQDQKNILLENPKRFHLGQSPPSSFLTLLYVPVVWNYYYRHLYDNFTSFDNLSIVDVNLPSALKAASSSSSSLSSPSLTSSFSCTSVSSESSG